MPSRKYYPGYKHNTTVGIVEYLEKIPSTDHHIAKWKCFCGETFEAGVNHIIKNNIKSCGCWRKFVTEQKVKDPSLEYLQNIYVNIKQRCYNKNNQAYKNYGARGITISNEWKNDGIKFAKDILNNLGNRPTDKHQLDRIDNNGNYEITNLRWVSTKENCRNKRSNKLLTINNQSKTISEWAEISGLTFGTISRRAKVGWPENELLKPARANKKIFDNNDFTDIFRGIKERCYYSKHISYKNYGGKGIILYEFWKNNYKQFQTDILNSIGPRPSPKHQLDRVDNNGNYEPGNLRWGTPKENNNNKSNNLMITINGETKKCFQWSKISGLSCSTIRERYNCGLKDNDLLKPVFSRKFNDEKVKNIKNLHNQGISITAIAKQMKCSQNTVTDIIRNRGAYQNKEMQ